MKVGNIQKISKKSTSQGGIAPYECPISKENQGRGEGAGWGMAPPISKRKKKIVFGKNISKKKYKVKNKNLVYLPLQ